MFIWKEWGKLRDKISKVLDDWENKKLGLSTDEEISKKEKRIFYGQKPVQLN